MSLPDNGARLPQLKKMVVTPSRSAGQSARQHKYVNILPRRPSDSTASTIHPSLTVSETKKENQFAFRNSTSFLGVFGTPIMDQQQIDLASLACSYQGQFPFLSLTSPQSTVDEVVKGQEKCLEIECKRLDDGKATSNSLEEERRSNLDILLGPEDLESEKSNQLEYKAQPKQNKDIVAPKFVGPAAGKLSKPAAKPTKNRDRATVTGVEAEEAVRRSKRKINPPNFFVTADNKKTDQEGKKAEDEEELVHSKSMSILGSSGRRVIRVGSSYQVDLPCSAQFVPAASSSVLETDKDECLWKADPDSMNDVKVLEDYCTVARRHQKLQADEAMEALYRNEYSVTETLNRLEEYHPRRPPAEWSAEEIEVFNKQLNRASKRFHLVAKNLPDKSLADVVEYYYKMKPTRCFLASSAFMTCPFIESHNVLDPPSTPRSECQNCVNDIGRNTAMKADNRGKKRVLPACPACDLYSKLTKRYRPFTTPLDGKGNKCVSPKKSENCPQIRDCRTINEQHPHCFFVPRLASLIRGVDWSAADISTCVKGFRKHGNNFKAIASELIGKDAYDVADFYTSNQLTYRLDFMISLFERDSITSAAPISRVKRHNKEVAEKTLKKVRPHCLEDMEEEDMDKSKDVVLKTNIRANGYLKSSVVTRNQRKQRHTAIGPAAKPVAPTCEAAPAPI